MSERPPEDNPEFIVWLQEQIAEDAKRINDAPSVSFDEAGPVFGDIKNLDKTDAELFPDEIAEYTPEERRKFFKLHKNRPSLEHMETGIKSVRKAAAEKICAQEPNKSGNDQLSRDDKCKDKPDCGD